MTTHLKFLYANGGVTVPGFDPANFVVLVVDDEAAVRNLIMTVLRRAGYQVLDAVNGEVMFSTNEPNPEDWSHFDTASS